MIPWHDTMQGNFAYLGELVHGKKIRLFLFPALCENKPRISGENIN